MLTTNKERIGFLRAHLLVTLSVLAQKNLTQFRPVVNGTTMEERITRALAELNKLKEA